MIDLRLWRLALLLVVPALVVAMFSLQDVPRPLEQTLPPDAFEGAAAASLAADLADVAPEPRPGSDGDEALAEAILDRFKQIPSIEVSEQRFEAAHDGEDVELRNLIAKLPGQSERQVALLAGRDVLRGSGAASTVASSAALLETAAGFAGSTHEKTLVFVSTDGASIGALGARRFAADYTDADLLDAVIVLSQPAADPPTQPLVLPWSAGVQSTGSKLSESADAMVSAEVGEPAGDEGPVSELFRLAIPSTLGEQGPLVESGLDSVRLSSSGELPPPPDRDEAAEVDADSLDRFGRAALALTLAIDSAREPLEHGPSTYVGLAGNLLPGWALSLLALSLLVAVAVTAFAGVAVSAHSPLQAARALGWAALRSVPLLLAFALVMLGALAGLVPSPEFPFLPGYQELGTAGTIALSVAAVVLGFATFLLRPLLAPPPALAALAPAASVSLAAVAAFGVWLLNPYLALLVAIGLQLWLVAASGWAPGRLAAAGLVFAGTIPAVAAVAALAGRFDTGLGVVWDLLYMLTGGQLPARQALLGCVLAGAGLAIVAARGEPRDDAEQLSLSGLVARGRVLEQRRARRAEGAAKPARGRLRRKRRKRRAERRPRGERAPEQYAPSEHAPETPEAPAPPPAGDQPERDPRMWSKPPGSSSRPSRASTVTPSPSITRPTSVSW